MDSTDYYNQNAASYFERTVSLDMKEYQDKFLAYIPDGGSILDLGCGSGRDSEYFLSNGYDVTAVDGSSEMCKLASVHIGQDVLCMLFSDINFQEVFDGIWACASLLHVPKKEIVDILQKVIASLKVNGVLYMTFRYGEFEGIRDGRYFTEYRVRDLKELIANFENVELLEIRKTEDVRSEEEALWIHALVKRVE